MEERVKLKAEITKLLKSDKELIENHMEIIESLNGYSEYTKELKEKIFELNKHTRDDKWILIGRFIFLLDSDKSYKKIDFYKENLKEYYLIRNEEEKQHFMNENPIKSKAEISKELEKEIDVINKKSKWSKDILKEREVILKIKELLPKEKIEESKDLIQEDIKAVLNRKNDFIKGYECLESLKNYGLKIDDTNIIFNISKDEKSFLKKRYTLYEKFPEKSEAIQKISINKLKIITKKGATTSEQKKALDEVK